MKRFFISILLLSGWTVSIHAQYRPSPLNMTIIEKIPYEMYQSEIDSLVKIEGREKYDAIRNGYDIPRKKLVDLARYVAWRERRKCAYDYIYPDNTEKRLAAQQKVDMQFQDSIDAVLFTSRNFSDLYSSRILRMTPRGKFFSAEQYDSLMNRALVMFRKKVANPDIDLYDDDIAALQSVFSDRDVRRYICLFNNTEINKQLNKVWRKIKDYDLTQRYDSARACAQIYHYLQKEMTVNVIFKNKPQLQKQAIRALAPERPEAYRMYKSLVLREDIEGKKQKALNKQNGNEKPKAKKGENPNKQKNNDKPNDKLMF